MTTDLKERFSLVDDVEAPSLWAEVRRRAAAPQAPPRALEWPPGVSRRLAVGALAVAVVAAAAFFAWDLGHLGGRPVPNPLPTVDLSAELPPGWSELPAPPANPSGAATAWTGSQLLVWGGYEYVGSGDEEPEADGFVFDALTRTWDAMPPSPLDARMDPAYGWTGKELLIWGGWDGGFRGDPYRADGAAFDPRTRTWRPLPPAPIGARSPFSVWTGTELIVWGSTDRGVRLRDGAAYDPKLDTWRRIADAPTDITDGSAIWTGEEMIVFGAALDSNNRADTPTAIAIAYEPGSDTWRRLPPSQLSPQAMTASWLDGEMVAWDYDQATAAYDPGADSWRSLPRTPLEFSECRPESVATPRIVFGDFCGKTVVLEAGHDEWRAVPLDLRPAPGGCCWVLEPVAAGDVVLVPAHLYGGLGLLERRLFVYNPPASATGDRASEGEPAPLIPDVVREGALRRMPVVFPDGTEATVVYAGSLDLAGLGVRPAVSYLWRDDPPPRFPIVFLHDPNASLDPYVRGDGPTRLINSSEGGIEVWRARGNDVERRFWLRYELPSWTVLVSVRDALASAVQVNASLELIESGSGFPVAKTSGPIALSHESGEGEGSMLEIGSTLDPSISLWLERCSGPNEADGSGGYGSVCLAGGRVRADIYGTPADVRNIAAGLDVEDLQGPA